MAGVQLRKCAAFVDVARSTAPPLGWVSSYELQILDPVTSKWRVIVAATTANSSALEVAMLDLRPYYTQSGGGVYARRLRIRPLTFVHSPTLRAVVYGRASTMEKEEEKTDENHSKTAATPITVEYYVAETRAKADCRFVRNGLTRHYGYCDMKQYDKYPYTKAKMRHYFGQCIMYDRNDEPPAAAAVEEEGAVMAENDTRLKACRARRTLWDFVAAAATEM